MQLPNYMAQSTTNMLSCKPSRHVRVGLALLVFTCAALLISSFVLPVQAHALETYRWTAKANKDGGGGIMGATPTRVTWQGQADEGESIESVDIVFPDGSSFDPTKVTVTVLNGLDRLDVTSEVTRHNNVVARVQFPEPTPAGTMVMVELNEFEFPAEGASYPMVGSYVTAEGLEYDIADTGKTIDIIGVTLPEKLSLWLGDQEWVQSWNSNTFLHLFFDPTIIVTSVPIVFWGWLLVMGLVLISFPLAIPFGLMWSFLRMAKNPVARAIGSTYINIVRGTPLFLQIYIAFFGLPLLKINIDNFVLGIIVLVLNSSAYLAEVFRAGIQSINKGQFEASRSLGMNGAQTMLFVIIPQTVRRVIPTMTSEFILMYKDTSLLAAVGVSDIMMFSKTITAATGNVTPYIVAAGFYLVVTIPLTKLISIMEDRMAGVRPRKRKKNVNKFPPDDNHGMGGGTGSAGKDIDPNDDAAVSRSLRTSEMFAVSNTSFDVCTVRG